MSRTPQEELTFRVKRTLGMVVVLTTLALVLIDFDPYPPGGNPLVYGLAMSWLISIALSLPTGNLFLRLEPRLFSLARWERDGAVYDRMTVRAFRWGLLHTPIGWMNPNMRCDGRTDGDRLLRAINAAEAVHWLSGLAQVLLAVVCLAGGYAAYGYALLLGNVPVNVYPILVQRLNRGRVYRLLRRGARTVSV